MNGLRFLKTHGAASLRLGFHKVAAPTAPAAALPALLQRARERCGGGGPPVPAVKPLEPLEPFAAAAPGAPPAPAESEPHELASMSPLTASRAPPPRPPAQHASSTGALLAGAPPPPPAPVQSGHATSFTPY